MNRIVSVNVGLPRDIQWQGRTVHTGIWKYPLQGRCLVGRLNLAGDGQGDLAGHGGEHRAVFVYQMESYEYWQRQLRRTNFEHGQFGENLTVEGLPDNEVCIGDRYQIGTALFEVTQPRVTCYRVGIRLNEPRMPALLTSSGRPGFYFRVLREGDVGYGDRIQKVDEPKERMTVAEINALLYSPNHDPVLLERALRIGALSSGWRSSFEALLKNRSSGNAGLLPEAASHPAASGFRPLVVTSIVQESADVVSLNLAGGDHQPLPTALPGQYVVVRLKSIPQDNPLYRSYSLSGPTSAQHYRISVKLEPDGKAGAFLRDHLKTGDSVDVSAPRGDFILQPTETPVVLLSAGIGTTPLLAMLHSLSEARSTRQVLWLQAARDGQHRPFSAEVSGLLRSLVHGRSYICYSRPSSSEHVGNGFDAIGHFSQSLFHKAGLPPTADVYLCGPDRFMTDMKQALAEYGVPGKRVHLEVFNGGKSFTPGIADTVTRAPHPLANDTSNGPLISFARSGVVAHWQGSKFQSILELAEACDVPVRWSCRAGVCHTCESGLVSGSVTYRPEPLDRPADGNLLVCCSQPSGDVVVDL